jgi:hypothetical protein
MERNSEPNMERVTGRITGDITGGNDGEDHSAPRLGQRTTSARRSDGGFRVAMNHVRHMPLALAAVVLLGAVQAAPADELKPHVIPTRDVDVTYRITRLNQPTTTSRRRWLASERLVRIDGPDKSATIFDRNKQEFTLLNPSSRTFRKLEGLPRMPMAPETSAALQRDGESKIAGLSCIDWSWTVDTETHTACLTADGVLLRLVIDGKTVMQAVSVKYGRQAPDLFQIPRGYQPAIAPEGGSAE